MYEALEYYQSLAEKFNSRILTVPGIIIVLVGLCIWLAGLRWRKILGALAGGAAFAAVVMSIGSYEVRVIFAAALIGIAIGALFEKVVLGIFGTAIAAVIVLVIISATIKQRQYSDIEYLSNNMKETTEEELLSETYCPRWPEYERNDAVISFSQAAGISTQIGSYIASKTMTNIKSSPFAAFAAAGIAAIAAGLAAFMLPRIFIAAVSSLLGSAVIFAGMIMLLFYKGSKPVNYIYEQGQFYVTVIIAMVIFGTVVQLVLSPCTAAVTTPADEAANKTKGDKK